MHDQEHQPCPQIISRRNDWVTRMKPGERLHEGRCAFLDEQRRRCDRPGTHRVVLLMTDPDCRWVKKIVLAINGFPHLRCPAHQEREATVYFDSALWARMVVSYVADVRAIGHEARPSRDLTRVGFEQIDEQIGTIPILAARPDGKLEVVARARLIK